jgi:hypothetical protein
MREIIDTAGDLAMSAEWVDIAFKYGRYEVCWYLNDKGADLTRKVYDSQVKKNFTPLLRALSLSKIDLIKWLVETQGVELNIEDDDFDQVSLRCFFCLKEMLGSGALLDRISKKYFAAEEICLDSLSFKFDE